MIPIESVVKVLRKYKFCLHSESELQNEIFKVLLQSFSSVEKEKKLGDKSRVDFFIDGLAIEVKIKGSAKSIYNQCVRYCGFDEVMALLLLTNRSMGFPECINNKPSYLLSLGGSWL